MLIRVNTWFEQEENEAETIKVASNDCFLYWLICPISSKTDLYVQFHKIAYNGFTKSKETSLCISFVSNNKPKHPQTQFNMLLNIEKKVNLRIWRNKSRTINCFV